MSKESLVEIVRYQPSHQKAWDEFVRNEANNAPFFFQRAYLAYHQHRFVEHSLLVYQNNKIIVLLPATEDGQQLNSHGGLPFGGLVYHRQISFEQLLATFQKVLEYLTAQGFTKLVYKQVPAYFHIFPGEWEDYLLYVLKAESHSSELNMLVHLKEADRKVESRRKRGGKKAVKRGLSFQESNDWKGFWQVLEQNLQQRFGVNPVHTLAEIKTLKERFPENIRLYTVVSESAVCAGTVVFLHPGLVHAQYIATSPQGRASGANDLLFDALMKRYSQKKYFSLGVSNTREGVQLNQGLLTWKASWGARPVLHHRFEIPTVHSFLLDEI
ncbi:GNAT family N-acetyltransferase [Rapidithrix thailandica]|uniref:GNAT family N-acetyltransferase n=1 Tax=Rapidithrix thailandica TaxID=413964 RepID=A0AAW9S3F2_9BACT